MDCDDDCRPSMWGHVQLETALFLMLIVIFTPLDRKGHLIPLVVLVLAHVPITCILLHLCIVYFSLSLALSFHFCLSICINHIFNNKLKRYMSTREVGRGWLC